MAQSRRGLYFKNFKMKKVVFFTGAGISAESGIPTFRDENGLWHGHDPMKLANIEMWNSMVNRDKNRRVMLDFYNQRRRDLKTVEPNAAHFAIANFQKEHGDTIVITQNVDDLHERAGSSSIIHLHGELLKARTTLTEEVVDWPGDIHLGTKGPDGSQLRPHIVWFGEPVPEMWAASNRLSDADIVVVIGTSLQVDPAARVFEYASGAMKFVVNPVIDNKHLLEDVGYFCFEENATTGVAKAIQKIKSLL